MGCRRRAFLGWQTAQRRLFHDNYPGVEIMSLGWATCIKPWVLVTIFLSLAAYVAQVATGVVVPPYITLGHAAPVRPEAIYVPGAGSDSQSVQTARFALEVPRFFRALGSVVANKELRESVRVSPAELLGQTATGRDILRIDYSYGATGADLGIQQYFDLTLNVTGSCVTEYNWYYATRVVEFDGALLAIDYYNTTFRDEFDDRIQATASLLDSKEPSATFYVNVESIPGTLDGSNHTWGAILSTVNRTSFSSGTDPWYLTDAVAPGVVGTEYSVRPGRPGLSCWEDKVWSYRGHTTTTDKLTSDAVPGLNLPKFLQETLAQYVGVSSVYDVGTHLQKSALLSSTTALGSIFDAGNSSVHDDLERLVVAAYVSTVNCLTDTTLYPDNAQGRVPNAALSDAGQVPRDPGFLVLSPEVDTLSILVVIAIPAILVGTWLISVILLYLTPIKIVMMLNSTDIQEAVVPGPEQHVRKGDHPGSVVVADDVEKTGGLKTKSESIPDTTPAQSPQK
ncbi:hypothetical protein SAMD00023353_2001740 [Rosellinia necatrix]|uniref:Uncharacterized protein n=1 Tax=Rosellinia necatrix TaxID=77044 RepID=A0A1W2TEW0_ROSNE|nr:hypothetical protein SAMD00023353_2001740 [Rosellinia necatrix]